MSASKKQDRRHIHYVDHTLQKWLLLALVVMEAVLVSLAIWALYKALGTIIDEDMYRVHYSASTQLLPLLIKEGSVVLGWMLLANLLALFVADRIWASIEPQAGIDAAWHDEIVRRVAQLEAGEVETIPHEEVIARLRAKFG